MNRALLLLPFLAACATTPPPVQHGPAPAAVLQPGDHVSIQVYRNQEMSGTFTVAPDSTVQHPVFRGVKVAGVPLPTAEQRMREALLRFEADPMFAFGPEYRVYVGGLVREQNQFFLPEVTVAQAVSRAGGSTAPDKTRRLRFVRGGKQTVVALSDPHAAEILQMPIRSGDQIIIEEQPSFTRAYLDPALRVVQTVGAVLSTFVILSNVLDEDEPKTP